MNIGLILSLYSLVGNTTRVEWYWDFFNQGCFEVENINKKLKAYNMPILNREYIGKGGIGFSVKQKNHLGVGGRWFQLSSVSESEKWKIESSYILYIGEFYYTFCLHPFLHITLSIGLGGGDHYLEFITPKSIPFDSIFTTQPQVSKLSSYAFPILSSSSDFLFTIKKRIGVGLKIGYAYQPYKEKEWKFMQAPIQEGPIWSCRGLYLHLYMMWVLYSGR